MNTGKLKLALATILISSLSFSCKKEKTSEGACKINMTDLSGTYKLASIKYKVKFNTQEQDVLAVMDDCFKDDLVILNPTGAYNQEDAGIACSPDNSNASSGEWALQGNRVISEGVLNGIISSFDCKTLVYHLDDVYITGDSFVYVLEKQ